MDLSALKIKCKEHALLMKSDVPSTDEVWLFKTEDLLGFIVSDQYFEEIDNHCEECQKEFLPFKFKSEILSTYLIFSVGPSKLEKIKKNNLIPNITLIERLV